MAALGLKSTGAAHPAGERARATLNGSCKIGRAHV